MKGTESTVLPPVRQGPPSPGPAGAAGAVSCGLPGRYDAVKSARDFTRQTLGHWGLAEQFDTVGLVVSELVTNALRHGLADAPRPTVDPPVRLDLVRWTSRLVCAVRDPSSAPPVARLPEIDPELTGPPESARHPGVPAPARSPEAVVTPAATAPLPVLVDAPDDEPTGVPAAAESGRGLFLVHCFSDTWGWQPVAEGGSGKVVWALFRLGGGHV